MRPITVDPSDIRFRMQLNKDQVESEELLPASLMPPGLIGQEVADLFAYLPEREKA